MSRRSLLALAAGTLFTRCEQNTFVPPPPLVVEVARPVQKTITRYLETTGSLAPIKSVDLVARVQGFLQSINYRDGTFAKEATTLFTIEPQNYRLKLDEAQGALDYGKAERAATPARPVPGRQKRRHGVVTRSGEGG